MEKEFVPYELALKMKEIGFDEPCFTIYSSNCTLQNSLIDIQEGFTNDDLGKAILAPTFSQAFRWFREKHRIITEIKFYNNGEEWEETEFTVTINRFEDFPTHNTFVKSDIKTYEEAELICLEKLIEIIENKQK